MSVGYGLGMLAIGMAVTVAGIVLFFFADKILD